MKKSVLAIALSAFSLCLYAGETTGSTTLGGTAEQTCSITNSPSLNLAFTGLEDATGNFNVGVICNSGLAWTATIDGGVAASGEVRRASSGADHLKYRLYKDASMLQEVGVTANNSMSGTGTGSAETIDVYAKVALVDNNPQPATGTYSDTLNVTIAW